MKLLEPRALAELLGAEALPTRAPTGTGVAFTSASVRPGDVFFARAGASRHGIDYAQEALDRGAAFLVSDRPHPQALLVADAHSALLKLGIAARELVTGTVIGVTGSAGKTTTKTLLTHALSGRSTPGNLNTPPALVAALVEAALMDRAGSTASYSRGALVGEGAAGSPVVLELGIDRLGEMDELIDLTAPEHGVITTIGEAHLAALSDKATVAEQKARLLIRAPGHKVVSGAAAQALPADVLAQSVAAVVAGSAEPPPGLLAVARGSLSDDGVLTAFGASARLPFSGGAMAENVMLALTLAVRLGHDPQSALTRMCAAPLEHSRLERVSLGDITLIDDSYNSNPLSAALALEVLNLAPAPRVAFLGDMRELGAVSEQRHLELGAATTGLDLVVAIGAAAAAMRRSNPLVLLASDAEDAVKYLDKLPPAATVLVKGSRSLELERLVGHLKSRFGAPSDGASAATGSNDSDARRSRARTEATSW